jgi:hypothetical protein
VLDPGSVTVDGYEKSGVFRTLFDPVRTLFE